MVDAGAAFPFAFGEDTTPWTPDVGEATCEDVAGEEATQEDGYLVYHEKGALVVDFNNEGEDQEEPDVEKGEEVVEEEPAEEEFVGAEEGEEEILDEDPAEDWLDFMDRSMPLEDPLTDGYAEEDDGDQ